jgi:hypothetical protein
MDEKTEVMAKMKKLKQIRRELDILIEVVTIQERVLRQMTDELEAEEPPWIEFTSSQSLRNRRTRRVEKLERRRRTIEGLGQKAEAIISNVNIHLPTESLIQF